MEYPVMESFYTLQGEGIHQGKASYFIRIAGCDVGCHWCDVKESWSSEAYPKLTIEKLLELADQFSSKMIVITGGEPTHYNLEPLTTAFRKAGFSMHIETSGAYLLTGNWDWICLSPKKFKNPQDTIWKKANELKVVIYHSSDLKWAFEMESLVSPECSLILQPEWSVKEKVMPLIVAFVQQNPKWRMGMQTHKYINIP